MPQTNPQTYVLRTEVGLLEARIEEEAIVQIRFLNGSSSSQSTKTPTPLRTFASCIRAYCAGDGASFDTLPFRAHGTAFQEAVWKAVARIPYGETKTYGAIAREIGRPRAARAVGTALASNPLAIAIPCHRVVPASGGIGEFAWGKRRKEMLLALESKHRKKGNPH